MSQALPEKQANTRYVLIGKAAEILGVSIDTVRRWDKAGKLHSVRLDGKNRYFSIAELEQVKESQPLKIAEAAEALGVSASTLRRREKEGLIVPGRGNAGERLYTKETLGLLSKRKQAMVVKSEEPVKAEAVEPVEAEVKKPRVSQIVIKLPRWKGLRMKGRLKGVREAVGRGLSSGFRALKPVAKSPALAFIAGIILMMMNLNLMMSKFMTQYGPAPVRQEAAEVQVLGAESEKQGIFSRIGSWFGKLRSSVTREYKQVIKREEVIENINEVFVQTEVEDEIAPRKTLVITESSLLKIKETTVIENLNAEFLQGKVPGDEVGDLAVFGANNQITALKVGYSNLLAGSVVGGTGGVISDGSITAADLADGVLTAAEIADATITAVEIKDGEIKEAELASDSVTAGKIKDGEVKTAELADGAVTSGKISDNTITAGDLAGNLDLSDGDLLDMSAINHSDTAKMGLILPNVSSASPSSPSSEEGYIAYDTANDQVLVYDGSSWSEIGGSITLTSSGTSANIASNSGLELASGELAMLRGCTDAQILKWNDNLEEWQCSLDVGVGGAGISTVQEANVDKIDSATQMDFTNDFNVTNAGGGEAGIAIDYTNSGITKKGGNETISGSWSFSGGLTVSSGTVSLPVGEIGNTELANSSLTVTAGTGLSGGGEVSLGGSTSLAATLGTSIDTSEIDANTIALADVANSLTFDADLTLVSDSATNDYKLVLDNSSTGDVANLLQVTTSGTGATVTTAVDVSDADIVTALAIGANTITTAAKTLESTELDVLDAGISLAELSNVGTDTATTGNIQVADGNSWESVGMTGDVTIISTGATTIGADKILESHLEAVDGADDEDCLTYEIGGTDDFEWQPCGGGGGSLDDAYNDSAATVVVDAYDVTWQLADATDDWKMVIDNTTAGEIATALSITTSVGGGTFVTAIDVSDGEIATALAIGANDITTAAKTLESTELDILDAGIALSELASSGNLALSAAASEGLSGGGLTDCNNATTSKLLWDSATNKFSCGADQNSGGATAWDVINDPSGAGDIAMAETAQTLDWNTDDTTAAAFDGLTITLTNDATTDSNIQRALVIQNTDAAGSTDTERLLVLDNADTTELVVTALEIISAAGKITTAIDVSDGEIDTALAIGANDITTSGGTIIASTELDVLDGGVALSELTSSGNLALSAGGNEGLSGGGLTDCNNATTSKLLWDTTTNKFSCGTDQTGGGGGTLQDAYTGGNTITTADATDITITLAEVTTPTTFEIFNNDTAGITALEVDNTIATGTLTNGLLVEQSGAGTMSNGVHVLGTAGTITDAIHIEDGAGAITDGIQFTGTFTNLINSTNFSVTNAGAVTAVGVNAGSGALEATGGLTVTGAVSVNTSGSNATNIGTGTNAGTITIGNTSTGDLVLSDANWSIAGGGAATLASVDSGSGTIQTTGSVLGDAIDRTTSGTLTIGNTTADSVSICNSTACDTITIGTNTDADTITIGDNNDIFSINSSAFDVTTTGEVSGVTTMASSGNWDWSAATAPTITIKADDTFTISDVGGAFNFSVDTGPSYTGDARPTKKITLIPEFSGATLTGDGTSNVGTMTSDFCSKTNTNPPDINIGVCVTAGDLHNYYSWTAQATNDYDIWIPWQVPSDFGEFASSTAIQFYGWRTSNSAGTDVTLTVYDDNDAICNAATAISGTVATWNATNYADPIGCGAIAAGDTITFRVQLSVGVNDEYARIGEISISYLATF